MDQPPHHMIIVEAHGRTMTNTATSRDNESFPIPTNVRVVMNCNYTASYATDEDQTLLWLLKISKVNYDFTITEDNYERRIIDRIINDLSSSSGSNPTNLCVYSGYKQGGKIQCPNLWLEHDREGVFRTGIYETPVIQDSGTVSAVMDKIMTKSYVIPRPSSHIKAPEWLKKVNQDYKRNLLEPGMCLKDIVTQYATMYPNDIVTIYVMACRVTPDNLTTTDMVLKSVSDQGIPFQEYITDHMPDEMILINNNQSGKLIDESKEINTKIEKLKNENENLTKSLDEISRLDEGCHTMSYIPEKIFANGRNIILLGEKLDDNKTKLANQDAAQKKAQYLIDEMKRIDNLETFSKKTLELDVQHLEYKIEHLKKTGKNHDIETIMLNYIRKQIIMLEGIESVLKEVDKINDPWELYPMMSALVSELYAPKWENKKNSRPRIILNHMNARVEELGLKSQSQIGGNNLRYLTRYMKAKIDYNHNVASI